MTFLSWFFGQEQQPAMVPGHLFRRRSKASPKHVYAGNCSLLKGCLLRVEPAEVKSDDDFFFEVNRALQFSLVREDGDIFFFHWHGDDDMDYEFHFEEEDLENAEALELALLRGLHKAVRGKPAPAKAPVEELLELWDPDDNDTQANEPDDAPESPGRKAKGKITIRYESDSPARSATKPIERNISPRQEPLSSPSSEQPLEETRDESTQETIHRLRYGRSYKGKATKSAASRVRVDDLVNRMMDLSLKDNRGWVVRGSNLDMYVPKDDGAVDRSSSVVKFQHGKRLLHPHASMLHDQGKSMMLVDPKTANHVYGVDLETGKMVYDFEAHDTLAIRGIHGATKYAQLTPEQTFSGFASNSLFKVDPRVGKVVDSEKYDYSSMRDIFTAIATTEKGEVALATSTGDIRLYDKYGKRAKSLLTTVGESITALDVSADSKWLLATTAQKILLLNTLLEDSDRTRFFRSSSTPPRLITLQLRPSDVSLFHIYDPLTPARFNTGTCGETTIVSGAGLYLFEWKLDDCLREARYKKYRMERLEERIVDSAFLHGQDNQCLVATVNNATMVDGKRLVDTAAVLVD